MEFYSYHGCFEAENIAGNFFKVDIRLEANLVNSSLSDKLEDTVNYQRVYELIAEEMKIQSKLLENVCHRIIDKLYKTFKEISKIRVKVSKLNPPMGGKIEKVSVTIEK